MTWLIGFAAGALAYYLLERGLELLKSYLEVRAERQYRLDHPASKDDVFISKLWAKEFCRQMKNDLEVGELIHRDFDAEVAECKDRVNITKLESLRDEAVSKPMKVIVDENMKAVLYD